MSAGNPINLEKISRLQYSAFANTLRLHRDSITLFRCGSYATAYFISILALEELGKVLMLDDLIFGVEISEWDLKTCKEWFKITYNHSVKQRWLLNDKVAFGNRRVRELFSKMVRGDFDIEKQDSMYVGLENRDLKKKIKVPAVKRVKAKRQIRLLNDAISELASRRIAEGELFDGYYVDELLTKSLLGELDQFRSELL